MCVSPHQNLVFYLQRNYLKSLSTCPKDVVIAQNIFSAFLLGSFLVEHIFFKVVLEVHHMKVEFLFLEQAKATGVVSGKQHR